MASRRELAVQAAKALLEAGGGPAGLGMHRSPARSLELDELPAGALYVVEETVSLENIQPQVERSFLLVIQWRVEMDPFTESPDEALDPLLAWGTKQLAGSDLGGILIEGAAEVKIEWEVAEAGEKTVARAGQQFLCRYYTHQSDMEDAG